MILRWFVLSWAVASPLAAQKVTPGDSGWLAVTVEAFVDVQIQDASGRVTGMDFNTGYPRKGLPNSDYSPYEAIDDDVTGEPDQHPAQQIYLEVQAPEDVILRFRSSKKAAASADVDFSDQEYRSVRRKIQIRPGQFARVIEFRVHLDPKSVSACRLVPMSSNPSSGH